ncbi:hypothetical protein [Methylocella tundrae]|nr:hypothetical protein [Methylocella tundrae]WPP04780.1 hypothetical protein SIN04_02805 [Methylocella tundrae]
MARMLFPARRQNYSLSFSFNGHAFHATFSFLDIEGYFVGEIFLTPEKTSSQLEALARDAMIFASLALQHGATLESLKAAMTRDDRFGYTSVAGQAIGAVADMVEHIKAVGLHENA